MNNRKKTMFWQSVCPACGTENNVYIYDRGYKFWRRLLDGNNRFACGNCKVTWRRKWPDDYLAFANKNRAE